MRATLVMAMLILISGGVPAAAAGTAKSAHDFTFTAIEGGPLPLSDFRGKVVLVVNTASFCGFTPQYENLQAVWDRYRDRGLVVLGVPSNDFGAQEPGSEADIKAFTDHEYAVDFPLTTKVAVRGDAPHPFFAWAKRDNGVEPRWNFTKILIAPDGRIAAAFPSRVEPDSPELVRAVEALLPAGGMSRPASPPAILPGLIP